VEDILYRDRKGNYFKNLIINILNKTPCSVDVSEYVGNYFQFDLTNGFPEEKIESLENSLKD